MTVDALLDTSVMIDLLNSFSPALEWYASQHKTILAITSITWFEVIEGTRNKTEQMHTIRFMRQHKIEHPLPNDLQWAVLQFGRFHLSHHVDWEDLLIASVALRLGIPLYTTNMRHFRPLSDVEIRRPY